MIEMKERETRAIPRFADGICPLCDRGTELVMTENGAYWLCTNSHIELANYLNRKG